MGQFTRDEASAKLVEYINKLASSGNLEDWFAFRRQTTLRRLSAFNQMAIYSQAMQYGFEPTNVQGAKGWQKNFGRKVKGPEWQRKLFYYAPVFRYYKVENEDGEEETRKNLVGFTVVYGFDVSQTEGKPLPEAVDLPSYTPTGDDAHLNWEPLAAYAEAQGCTVKIGDCGRADGYYSPLADEIMVSDRLEPNGQVHALIHETCHAVGFKRHEQKRKAYDEAEIVTETAAFFVADALGFDVVREAASYIVQWANANVEKALTYFGEADRMADEILAALVPAGEPVAATA